MQLKLQAPIARLLCAFTGTLLIFGGGWKRDCVFSSTPMRMELSGNLSLGALHLRELLLHMECD